MDSINDVTQKRMYLILIFIHTEQSGGLRNGSKLHDLKNEFIILHRIVYFKNQNIESQIPEIQAVLRSNQKHILQFLLLTRVSFFSSDSLNEL